MFSKHGYSPARSSLLAKSRSQGEFYRQATQRSQNQLPAPDCLACRHEQQHLPALPLKTQHQQHEYYTTTETQQVDNLRKAKRFLQQLLERQKQEHRQAMSMSEMKGKRLGEELELKEEELRQMRVVNQQQQVQLQQVSSNRLPVSASLIRSYAALPEQDEEEDKRYRRARELGKRIDKLEVQLEETKEELANQRRRSAENAANELKLKEFEIISKQYEAMRLLIAKMEEQKAKTAAKQEKELAEAQRQQQTLIEQHSIKVVELTQQLDLRIREAEEKGREIEKTRNQSIQVTSGQLEQLQELIQEKDRDCESLHSKLACVEADLQYLKNRFGYLLLLAKDNRAEQPESMEEFCIERVGRYNVSTGKQSLISMNLSPIKRR